MKVIAYYPKIFVNHYGKIFKISWELDDFVPDNEALQDIILRAKRSGITSFDELIKNPKKCGCDVEEVEDPEDGIVVDSIIIISPIILLASERKQ